MSEMCPLCGHEVTDELLVAKIAEAREFEARVRAAQLDELAARDEVLGALLGRS